MLVCARSIEVRHVSRSHCRYLGALKRSNALPHHFIDAGKTCAKVDSPPNKSKRTHVNHKTMKENYKKSSDLNNTLCYSYLRGYKTHKTLKHPVFLNLYFGSV